MTTVEKKIERQLARIEKLNPKIHAMITTTADDAYIAARALDEKAAAGASGGPLRGMSVTFKDNIWVKDILCTSGSKFFEDFVPKQDSTVARRLREAGGVFLGKNNLHELAFASTSQNPYYGSCRNPWDTDAIPGGSSGGSGAAVAAGMCDVSIGTDGGGSIRGPSAFNGVAGLRPTVGRIPNQGSVHFCPTFDTIGPMARMVHDVATAYEVIAGYDETDPTSVDVPVESWLNRRARGIVGLTAGVPRNFFFDGVDPDIIKAVRKGISVLSDLGITIVEFDIPGIENVQKNIGPVLMCDAAAYHRERLENHQDKFGRDVYDRMMIGYRVSGLDYSEGVRAKLSWCRQVERMFDKFDMIVTPTVDRVAPKVVDSQDPIEVTKVATRLIAPWSFAQVPALSVPCGFTSAGMPAGMQLVAPAFGEALLLAVGDAYQNATDHHFKRPPIWID